MLGTEGMFAALEERRAPGLVAMYGGILDKPKARSFARYLASMAEEASVPVSLILDHGASVAQCLRALAFGFSDVMYDGSSLPLEENIANTRLIVEAAHGMGACVEAELGHVGSGSEYQQYGAQRKGFTDPAIMERFVAETGVDFLAVAIGTAHGLYKGEPEIDLELLATLRAAVDIPLVLHGGTGLSVQQYKDAIAAGVSKINIFTNLSVTTGERMVEAAQGNEGTYFGLSEVIRATFQERCGFYVDVFGATGRM